MAFNIRLGLQILGNQFHAFLANHFYFKRTVLRLSPNTNGKAEFDKGLQFNPSPQTFAITICKYSVMKV